MKFQEAEDRLRGIAGGRYFSLLFERTTASSGKIETMCGLYIDGGIYHTQPTWEEAFQSLDGTLKPNIEESPEVEA